MKLMLKGFLSIMLLASGTITWNVSADSCSTSTCGSSDVKCDNESVDCPRVHGDVCGTKTHFSLRPQHSNEARKMTAVEDKIHRYGVEEFNGVVSLGLQYQQTFKPEEIAKYFFGKQTLTFGPTCDGTYDIFGENIGTTTTGSITWKPRIRNFIADFDFWFGLDELVCGLWTRIDVPVNWTQWDLRPCIVTDTVGTPAPFVAGQVDFLSAGTQDSLGAAQGLAGEAFGAAPRLECGKICKTHDTTVSGLSFDLGYDFFRRECSHFGASIHFVAPTGTRPSDEFLFSAVSGSQHSWELGATVTGSYLAWENCDGDQRLGLFFDATITHLFGAKQRRLFDLKRRTDGSTNPMSYWLLLKKFNPTTGAVEGLERAANVLCCDVKVEARVMADLALMVQYDCGCFSGALGWNFWVRSAERLKCNTSCDDRSNTSRHCEIPASTYGIKGSTIVDTTETMSNATIGNCGAIDDPSPVFLTTNDIDKCSALHPRAFSNKVFGWVGYNWRDCEWQPFVAVEGEVEFGNDNKAVDQWGVMLKGGVAF